MNQSIMKKAKRNPNDDDEGEKECQEDQDGNEDEDEKVGSYQKRGRLEWSELIVYDRTATRLCSTPKLKQRYWRLPPTKC